MPTFTDKFMTNNNIMFVITMVSLLFGLIGVIGIVYTIMSYKAQKKTEHAYEYILKEAEKEWKGQHTQEEIEVLKQKLKELVTQINIDIPNKAQITLLEFKEETLRNELTSIYSEHKKVMEELKRLNSITKNLSPEIDSYIKQELNRKISYKTANQKFLLAITLTIMLSIPGVYDFFTYINRYIIWITGAHISTSLLSFYIICLAVVSVYFTSVKLPKQLIFTTRNIKTTISSIVILFSLWILLLYIVMFDILIKISLIQLPLTVLSIIVFALAIKILLLKLSESN